jgi:hypothetical protein
MPNKKAVIWLNSAQEIAFKIENALLNSNETVGYANQWFETINQHPSQEASQRIWDSIKKIIQ